MQNNMLTTVSLGIICTSQVIKWTYLKPNLIRVFHTIM